MKIMKKKTNKRQTDQINVSVSTLRMQQNYIRFSGSFSTHCAHFLLALLIERSGTLVSSSLTKVIGNKQGLLGTKMLHIFRSFEIAINFC